MRFLFDFNMKKNQNKALDLLKVAEINNLYRRLNNDACDVLNVLLKTIKLLINQFLEKVEDADDLFKEEAVIISFVRDYMFVDFYNGVYKDYHLHPGYIVHEPVITDLSTEIQRIEAEYDFTGNKADKVFWGYEGDDSIEHFKAQNKNRYNSISDIHDILIAVLIHTHIPEDSVLGFILRLLGNKLIDDLELILVKIDTYAQEWEASRQVVGK